MKRNTRSTTARSGQQQPAPTGNGSANGKGRAKRGGGETPASSAPPSTKTVTPKRKAASKKAAAAAPADTGNDQPAAETPSGANGGEDAVELGQ